MCKLDSRKSNVPIMTNAVLIMDSILRDVLAGAGLAVMAPEAMSRAIPSLHPTSYVPVLRTSYQHR